MSRVLNDECEQPLEGGLSPYLAAGAQNLKRLVRHLDQKRSQELSTSGALLKPGAVGKI